MIPAEGFQAVITRLPARDGGVPLGFWWLRFRGLASPSRMLGLGMFRSNRLIGVPDNRFGLLVLVAILARILTANLVFGDGAVLLAREWFGGSFC